jgi:hypothetical protein
VRLQTDIVKAPESSRAIRASGSIMQKSKPADTTTAAENNEKHNQRRRPYASQQPAPRILNIGR